jgi:hypothetical protein
MMKLKKKKMRKCFSEAAVIRSLFPIWYGKKRREGTNKRTNIDQEETLKKMRKSDEEKKVMGLGVGSPNLANWKKLNSGTAVLWSFS